MGTITKYDISGIQDFIFNSNRLIENIGASRLVYETLHELLPMAIRNELNDTEFVIDWKEAPEFMIKDNDAIKAEILYIGGGNAIVAYRDSLTADKISERFTKLVFEKTYSLNAVSASIDTSFENFNEDMEKLHKTLERYKQRQIKSHPLYGIAITKLDSETGLPISVRKDLDGNYLSYDRYLKRKKADESIEADNIYINARDRFSLPKDLDNLGRSRRDSSFIGIVHIDGNDMGKFFNGKSIGATRSYSNAVAYIRKLSSTIDRLYKTAFKNLVHRIESNISYFVDQGLDIYTEGTKTFLPVRPIILEGDDITFVCDGRIALAAAEYFLDYINSIDLKNELDEFEDKLSACAGVSIVKSHFPFSTAYQIAEECCASAKAKGRYIKDLEFEDRLKSWMDFQICFSGAIGDLQMMRAKNYNISGLKDPSSIKNSNIPLKRYNLLWRPWLVSSEDEDVGNIYNWKYFKELFESFQDRKNNKENHNPSWPRSKVKELRNAFIKGKEAVYEVVQENESRGRILHNLLFLEPNAGFDSNDATPYFDILEVMDIYLPFKEVK